MKHLSVDDRLRVRDLYEGLVNALWLNRNVITERELFILVVEKMRSGNQRDLSADCEVEARRRFSKR
jgi:hypothetical protein